MINKPQVGDKFLFQNRTVTVTGFKNQFILYSVGKKQTGYTELTSFLSRSTSAPSLSTPAASVLLPRATADLKRVPKKTLNVSKVSEQDIQEDTSIHEDTSLFKLTKTRSTKLYVGVCIVALIAIYTQSKIFKKIIK